MTYNIVFTGGGTAGHVTPNLPIIDALSAEGWQIHYIGSAEGVERSMIEAVAIPFHGIRSGKLRRYFSWQNFVDPFNTLIGIVQSVRLLRRLKADVVFSKGGFVAFPVVIGAWLNRIPVIAHESDFTPGLANRLSFPFVDKICVTFAAASDYFHHPEKVAITGTPIRSMLLSGNKQKGLALCGFNLKKPCLLVIGGSQGSALLNQCVRESLNLLREQFQVIHLCGMGKVDEGYNNQLGYCQFDYVTDALADLYAAADVVVSRAGANSLYELLALEKPHVLVPLSLKFSRGDQIENARYFEQQGISTVLDEERLTPGLLLDTVHAVYNNRHDVVDKIRLLGIDSATQKIVSIIRTTLLDEALV